MKSEIVDGVSITNQTLWSTTDIVAFCKNANPRVRTINVSTARKSPRQNSTKKTLVPVTYVAAWTPEDAQLELPSAKLAKQLTNVLYDLVTSVDAPGDKVEQCLPAAIASDIYETLSRGKSGRSERRSFDPIDAALEFYNGIPINVNAPSIRLIKVDLKRSTERTTDTLAKVERKLARLRNARAVNNAKWADDERKLVARRNSLANRKEELAGKREKDQWKT
jgi:hypothetical protein